MENNKQILVTGASGRIGSHLVEQLTEAGHDVWFPKRRLMDLTSIDSTREFFAEHGPFDVIVHCAAAGCADVQDPDESIFRDNMRMVENILNNKDSWTQLINLGSGAEFDTRQSIDEFRESEVWNCYPDTPYGRSKNYINRRLRFFDIENADKRITNLRIFAIVDDQQRLFKRLVCCRSVPETMHIVNDRYFDYFGLDDLGTVIQHLIKTDTPPIDINAVYAQKYLISQVAALYAGVEIGIDSTGTNNYTGNSAVLDSLNLPLLGLEASVRKLYE
jgi:nucleoside-diphosphate-sugar epimerase